MSFAQAMSGLKVSSMGLNWLGHNIANANTTGYKQISGSYSDVYAAGKVGLGVDVAAIVQNFNDGSMTRTERNTDVAISGNGFFRVQDNNGGIFYTRDGQFLRNKNGDLINNQGMTVTGYAANIDKNGNAIIQSGAAPITLNISTEMMNAKASNLAKLTTNLNSQDTIKPKAFDINNPDDIESYNFATTMTAFDSQGHELEMAVYFVKTADNQWSIYAKNTGSQQARALGNLEFDGDGKLMDPDNAIFDFAYLGRNGANNGVLQIDLSNTFQQKVHQSSINSIDVDGHSAGEYIAFNIEDNGLITAHYSNQQKRVIGQIALSAFANPNGLVSQGGNTWATSNDSGNPINGIPGVGLMGKLTSGALEGSNVDMGNELINMMVMQRNYQSNAQTIKTQDQIMQSLVNLR